MRIDIIAKILAVVYERAQQAEQTAEQLADFGIAQHEMSVLSRQGSRPAGFLGDAQSGEGLVRKLVQSGIPQDQAELYAQGVEHGLSLVVARVENDRAEQAGQAMERQPLVEIMMWNSSLPPVIVVSMLSDSDAKPTPRPPSCVTISIR